jgi:hypothetical protein
LVPTGGAVIDVLIVVVVVFVVVVVIVVAVDQLRRFPRWIALRTIGIGGTRLGQIFRNGFLCAT